MDKISFFWLKLFEQRAHFRWRPLAWSAYVFFNPNVEVLSYAPVSLAGIYLTGFVWAPLVIIALPTTQEIAFGLYYNIQS